MQAGRDVAPSGGWIRLGDIRVHPNRREVLKDGAAIQLNWRAFDALLLLIDSAGAVVTRAQFFSALWPGVHVEDSSLNHCIVQLRRSLGDGIVETIPRIGYRLLILPEAEPNRVVVPLPAAGSTFQEVSQPRSKWSSQLRWILAVCGVLAAIGAATGSRGYLDHDAKRAEAKRLTDQAGQLARLGRLSEITEAMAMLQHAIELDPKLAIAHARIAEMMARSGMSNPGQEHEEAERAVSIDPSCAECHAILGWILMTRDWKWKPAAEHLQTALRLDPANAYAHMWNSQLLAAYGKLPEALAEADRAVELQPWNHVHVNTKGGILYLARRYDDGIAECRRALGLHPGYPAANDSLFRLFLMKRDYAEAVRASVASDTVYTGLSADLEQRFATNLLLVLREGGLPALSRRFLADLTGPQERVKRYYRAIWKVLAGDEDGAITELRQGANFRPFHMMYLRTDPAFDNLRTKPAFQELIATLGQ